MSWLLIVAILIISTLPLHAQGQASDAAKLKEDTQKVTSIIKGDKAKAQTYCQITNLADQIDKAIREKDTQKAQELAQKLNEMEKNLGPEYLALVEETQDVDPNSKEGQEVESIFDKLDSSCQH